MKLAIIGAGIGGLAAALALKMKGLEVAVFEEASEIRAVGAGIWMPPNAMIVLDRLGVGEQVRKHGVSLRKVRVLTDRGKPLMEVPQDIWVKRFGNPTVSIKRAELHRILASSLGTGVIQLGARCLRAEERTAGVTLEFASGGTAQFDALIGADGLHSVCREAIGDRRPLRYSGQTCYRGLCRMPMPQELVAESAEIWGKGVRFGCSQVSQDEVYWYATVTTGPGKRTSKEEIRKILDVKFGQFPGVVREVIRHIRAEDIIHGDLFDLEPGKTWVAGRIALLGDAAHATTPNLGQGAAMAIEDSWILGQELSDGRSPEVAFQKYNAIREKRVSGIIHQSWKAGKIAGLRNPVACAVRNLAISSVPRSWITNRLDQLYRESPAAERK